MLRGAEILCVCVRGEGGGGVETSVGSNGLSTLDAPIDFSSS